MTEEQLLKLERINNLRKDGVISQAEFEKLKRDIVGDASPVFVGRDGKVISQKSGKNRNVWGYLIGLIVIIAILGKLLSPKEKAVDSSLSAKTGTTKNNIIDSALTIEGEKLQKEATGNLKKYFSIKKDEFKGTSWCIPKTAPTYRNSNAVYLYFEKKENIVGNLRFVGQYAAEDWLFIQYAQFLIDGVNYDYYPNKMETDNGGGYIWEWFDDSASSSNVAIIGALAKAKTVKIRYVGRQYAKV
ncbi:SHOCT domain-containing protein [Emticicia sp. BO119]|uniref:SHOCT domain-containing protein n=1 Tax=Emticicia sp. BO119 TaxID=2757768 RepID=UPI0015F02395|nr:SHOCT domain-containing protein [Emticicia sp. BO119]MBA4852958.1 SHOCT domain-containing protein [Emticicia sp. BO119]